MSITRQGVTHVHLDDARGEQARRILSVELALKLHHENGLKAEGLVAEAQTILDFITPENTEEGSKEEPEKKLSHFGV